jgi:hypothetical protein
LKRLIKSFVTVALCILILATNITVYGQTMWNQTYGGPASENCFSLLKTNDGGYAMAGHTYSLGAGDADVWLVKTDQFGNLQWNQTFGTAGYEDAQDLLITDDGGYLIVARSTTFGAGDNDLWLIKTDTLGNMQWNKTIGGIDYDKAWRIIKTPDENYAFAGITRSFGAGGNDYWLLKTDYLGNVIWNTTIGGTGDDRARCLINTPDGGFLLTGWSNSYGAGALDVWLVKTDSLGNHQWNATYGGIETERSSSLISTNDGGYIIAGNTASFGEGETDIFVVKTDFQGNMEWNRTYGGPAGEISTKIINTDDGGYGIAGRTYSFGSGESDIWFIKIDQNGNIVFNQTYGGEMADISHSIIENDDGGYVISGYTASFGAGEDDFWLIKTDEYGVIPEFPSGEIFLIVVTISLFVITFKTKNKKQLFPQGFN